MTLNLHTLYIYQGVIDRLDCNIPLDIIVKAKCFVQKYLSAKCFVQNEFVNFIFICYYLSISPCIETINSATHIDNEIKKKLIFKFTYLYQYMLHIFVQGWPKFSYGSKIK